MYSRRARKRGQRCNFLCRHGLRNYKNRDSGHGITVITSDRSGIYQTRYKKGKLADSLLGDVFLESGTDWQSFSKYQESAWMANQSKWDFHFVILEWVA